MSAASRKSAGRSKPAKPTQLRARFRPQEGEPTGHTSDATVHRELRRLLWLLDFLSRDIAALRTGELLDLRDDIIAFCLSLNSSVGAINVMSKRDRQDMYLLAGTFEKGHDRLVEKLRDLLGELQSSILNGVSQLRSGEVWSPFEVGKGPEWELQLRKDGTVRRKFSSELRQGFLASAADLLSRWWPALRRCAHEPCGALFLPRHGRQKYHDPGCSQRTRWANFAPTRKRNYRKEYDDRVKREHGPNVHAQHRSKTKKGKK